jgi:hypothetical protein
MDDICAIEEFVERGKDGLYYAIIRIGGFKHEEMAAQLASGFHDIITREIESHGVKPVMAN